ncbi:hypothetical protein [Streptomyces virginiae]|uniref:Lipoprotein n=1 Tax=Streptomyces virginiae TaxID=1961 RepID=A0ABZ1TMX9_STRVG|nr:hypothetical protein [Streptomyces virginiae]WTB25857.1 hypothetical protein OG253_32760 [Streptomyces virginiae]
MKQLEKRDVGTGATRTSAYSEVTNDKAKYPLLTEKGRELRPAQAGEMSWRLLPGTRIGDLGLTEKVYADMDEPPRSWCQVTFTDAQRKDLAAGKTIQGTGFVSAKGKTFDARISWKKEGGKKKIVPSFG